jgi:hypothetical protein
VLPRAKPCIYTLIEEENPKNPNPRNVLPRTKPPFAELAEENPEPKP